MIPTLQLGQMGLTMASGNGQQIALDLHNAMVSYWEFQENDAGFVYSDARGAYPLNVRNTAGPRNTNTAGTNSGLIGRSYNPNTSEGNTAYIPLSSGFLLPNTNWTFGLWLTGLTNALGTARFLMGNVGATATDYQAQLRIDGADNQFHFAATPSGGATGLVSIDSGFNPSATDFALLTCTLDRGANEIRLRVQRIGGGGMTSVGAAFPSALYTGSSTANFCINDALSSDGTYFSGNRSGISKADQAFVLTGHAFTDADFAYLYNSELGKSWAQIQTDAGL